MARNKNRSGNRPGEVLGIGRLDPSAVNREPGVTPVPSADEARRHKRMNDGADELLPDAHGDSVQHGGGATGVDMGGSGEGTDIE